MRYILFKQCGHLRIDLWDGTKEECLDEFRREREDYTKGISVRVLEAHKQEGNLIINGYCFLGNVDYYLIQVPDKKRSSSI